MSILPADTQTLWYMPRGVADVNVYPTRRYTDALAHTKGVADVNEYPTRRYTDALAHTKGGGICKCVSYLQIHRRSGTYQVGWQM